MDAKLQESLKQFPAQNLYMKMLGLTITDLQDGYAEGRIPYKDDLLNPYASLHGGVLFSLADIVSGIAACTKGYYVTTIHGDMDYLLPAIDTEYVICKAKALRHGRSLAIYQTSIYSDKGQLLESGTFRFHVTGKKIE